MKSEQTALAQISKQWEQLKAGIDRGKKWGFFETRKEITPIECFFNMIAPEQQPMTVNELTEALHVIEHLTISTTDSKQISFASWLDEHRYRTSQDIDIEQAKDSSMEKKAPVLIPENSSLFSLLVKAHETLISHHEVANLHAQGQLPYSQVTYSQDELKESQAIYDIETTTQGVEANDKSTVIKDLVRKGVTIYGAAIIPGDASNHEDPILIEAIQNFTGDKIDTPHSKANKLYHFGGQFLHACLLQEFTNTTKLVEGDIQGLERGRTLGHINWSKDKNDTIYAMVNLKILTCTFADPVNKNSPQQFFAMGSDGLSLITLNDNELAKSMKQCGKEIKRETENNIVPITEIKAKIEIVKNESNTGYMFQVSEFTTKYNTPELVSTKAPEPIEKIIYKQM